MSRFNAWLNTRIYEAVSALPEDDYRGDRGLLFGSVHNTLNHLLIVDRLWIGRIAGEDRGVRALDEILYDDFPSLRMAREAEDERLIALVDGLDDARLGAPIAYTRIIGEGMQETWCDHILMTLTNHQTHHRGQVSAVLTQAGLGHPPLDLVFFLDEIGLS